MADAVEVIPGVLFLSVGPGAGRAADHHFSVESDPDFEYRPFWRDFGPPSLLHIHRFQELARAHMGSRCPPVYFVCSPRPTRLANGVLLAASFRMLHLGLSAASAFAPFARLSKRLPPYRDASQVASSHSLSVLDCLRGLQRALGLGWYDPRAFDATEWARGETAAGGDMNWLVPGKLLGMATVYDTGPGLTPVALGLLLHARGITCVVRLCEAFYDRSAFTSTGLRHVELVFEDGTTPPAAQREEFLEIVGGRDVVALHCRAGLGRTGTLAGCFVVRDYGFTANEAVGWIRLCRPGSVMGSQQNYLVAYARMLASDAGPHLKREAGKYRENQMSPAMRTRSTPKLAARLGPVARRAVLQGPLHILGPAAMQIARPVTRGTCPVASRRPR